MVLFPVYSVLFVIYWLSQNWHQGRVNFILATPIVCGLLLAFMLKIQLRFLGK
ncbi:putative membrane protein [Alteromonas macleodii]|uniref:Membrane protein n=2 Tax=Alteromonas macleodii TaxID=28108 RepID=A0AB36FSK8_ALTMA|nr:putative membrane protein [Alteromonas macleodii]OES35189.1 putative membrane protein [Alteromonas macleodii]OES37406.1 putative membrane protein [Alteromonas macleodii]OES42677.1 putative membrane protein [Alteromonas macleodii]